MILFQEAPGIPCDHDFNSSGSWNFPIYMVLNQEVQGILPINMILIQEVPGISFECDFNSRGPLNSILILF